MRWVALFGVALVFACSKPKTPDLPAQLVAESAHFRYFSRAGDNSVCPAVLGTLERHFSAVSAYFGGDAALARGPAHNKIDYFKYQDRADLRAHSSCSAFNAACYYADVGLQSSEVLNTHELVHAYLAPLGARHRLLEEGVAEALSCGHKRHPRPRYVEPSSAFDAQSWRLNTTQQFQTLYAAARWFVGYLLQQHGPAPFLRWYRALHADHGWAEAAWLFQDSYNANLEQTWQRAFESQDPETACVRVWECAQEREFPAGSSSCDGTGLLGTLHVQQPSWLEQDATASGGQGLRFGSCSGTALGGTALEGAVVEGTGVSRNAWSAIGLDHSRVIALPLEPGRYFTTQDPKYATARFQLYKQDLLAEQCVNGTVTELKLNGELSVAWAAKRVGERKFLSFVDLNASEGAGYRIVCASNTRASWCTSCGELCRPACDNNVAARDVLGADQRLRLELELSDQNAGWVRVVRTR